MNQSKLSSLSVFFSQQSHLPAELMSELQTFAASLPSDIDIDFLNDEETREKFLKAVACSRFLRDQVTKFPHLVSVFFRESELFADEEQTKDRLFKYLESHLVGVTELDRFSASLRVMRNQLLAQIIFRDLNRLQSTQQTCMQLSLIAEAMLQAALNFHCHLLEDHYGTPRNEAGVQQGMLILGMGKLGAWELNLSSDIDLIFVYPENGNTDHSKRAISNSQFFSKLGQGIIQSLDRITSDGFVFRVDMRLRPWGESGALVQNFDEMESYYLSYGREWERYAMIKARVVASNTTAQRSEELMDILGRFTYRRYIDFSVIEALRDMKKSINVEVQRKQLFDDIKRGSGGIREVEFIAQVFQLVRGGRDLELRDNRLLHILPALVKLGVMAEATAEGLTKAYLFLRDSEHAIQAYSDRQTQALPDDELTRFCLAYAMGYASWQTYLDQLRQYRKFVSDEFKAVIASANDENESEHEGPWQLVWQAPGDEASVELLENSIADAKPFISLLESLRGNSAVKSMQPLSKERLDKFMPLLLSGVVACETPAETLKRIVPLVQTIARRSAYLLLLSENPGTLKRLIELATSSPWIAEQLCKYPALLDELLDNRTLYHTPDKAQLRQELQQAISEIDSEDLEAQMEFLRYFRNAHALRVAACEISGITPLMKVSDYLTYLAEVILEYALHYVWGQMVAQYGYPDGDAREQANFAVIGYGKLGGIEMGHSSDLDLVFIHNASANGSTDGGSRSLKSIDNHTFYTRLGQKIIHLLNTKTMSGQLYEVDMRLRPSGNSGLLVSTIAAFEKYQQESAWVWEHQALVRARGIAGDSELCERFKLLRRKILQMPRDSLKLESEVALMREKMRKHLGSDKHGQPDEAFHLKHDPGGIVDIEFMVQYAVLAWSHAEPGLASNTDNIRILENLEQSKMLSVQEVEQLTEAYKAFRSVGHRLALQKLPSLVDGKLFSSQRQSVISIWQKIFSPVSRL